MNNIIIAIDDLHPEQGWGCEDDIQVSYLEKLWEEFGCRFTLFVPSNYHKQYPLSEHKDWIEYWKTKEWVELAAHGHYHMCNNPNIFGEQEFIELDYDNAKDRTEQMLSEWKQCDYMPSGFRMPGWGCTQESANVISENFKWVAAHDTINSQITWKTKQFYGCDGIHSSENISLYGNTFMFQSHIAGDWNDNVWNEENYEHFRNILNYLLSEYEISYKTMSAL